MLRFWPTFTVLSDIKISNDYTTDYGVGIDDMEKKADDVFDSNDYIDFKVHSGGQK